MPSDADRDPRVSEVLDLLEAPREAFRSTLVSSAEELRGMLSEASLSGRGREDVLAAELGPFAAGRVDTGRLATVLSDRTTLAPEAVAVMEEAARLLEDLADAPPEALPAVAEVPEGEDLRDAVRDALTRVGRAFGAARVAQLARSGAFREEEHRGLLQGLPFRKWTRGERGVAPPLVVTVQAGDLRPAGLGDFLGGTVRVVLVVQGTNAPPASLARLFAPGATVVQAISVEELAPVATSPGPAVAALFESGAGAVPFVHDPAGGPLPWERVTLGEDADAIRSRAADARWKEPSWRQDVEHLLALAVPPAGASAGATPEAGAGGARPDATPEEAKASADADRLAAWLLARTNLDDA